jgi:hypothetical protein
MEMKPSKIIGIFVLVIIVMLGLGWLFTGNDFFLYKYFAPKQEAVRRETFEQSKAYNQGVVQELQKQYLEYASATPEAKEALASVVLHQVADYPEDKLPAHLKTFVLKLRNDRTKTLELK